MKKFLPTLFLVLILFSSIIAYKSYVYITGVRTNISQTEIQLEKAQIEVVKQLNSLSTSNPQIRRLIEQFGGISQESRLSPEHLTALAATLELIKRMNFESVGSQKQLQEPPNLAQVFKAVDQLHDLQNKLNQSKAKKVFTDSTWEELIGPIETLLQQSAESEKK
jgi:hypothetical protein